MTRILLHPLEQAGELRPAPATLTARPSFPYYVEAAAVIAATTLSWSFDPREPDPVVELAEPVGYAWQLRLRFSNGLDWLRTVVFIGAEIDWADLTDVDPATLALLPDRISTPTGKTLITREETLARIAELDEESAGGIDYTLLFENGLI